MGPFLFKLVNKVTKVIWHCNVERTFQVKTRTTNYVLSNFMKVELNFIELGRITAFGKYVEQHHLPGRKTEEKRKEKLAFQLD